MNIKEIAHKGLEILVYLTAGTFFIWLIKIMLEEII